MLKRVPISITGVALGLASLGNLLKGISNTLYYTCGILAAGILLLFLLKVFAFPKDVRGDLKNPIMLSVSATFPMTIVLLSGYAKSFLGMAADVFWYLGIALHVMLIVYFTAKFMLYLKLEQVFASCFIVYVGIAAASITAPAFHNKALGMAAFCFGFTMLLLLLILVTYRYVCCKTIPEPARPLFCVYAAPTSLCLAGYLQSFDSKSTVMVVFLALLSAVLYVIVLLHIPSFLRMQFYPSNACFTFPFIISAVAMKQTMMYFAKVGYDVAWMRWIVTAQTLIAVFLTGCALIRFGTFILYNKTKISARNRTYTTN